jgi:hypothetical protein
MRKLFSTIILSSVLFSFLYSQELALNKFHYIMIDSSRQKWGDFAEPGWLRYFGISFQDIDNDDYNDIVSGRYCYINPGGNMEGLWERYDLGMNVDAMVSVDVDDDIYADVIAQALPDVYWLEAQDLQAKNWKAKKIATLPKTGHVNAQGYGLADVFTGGKKEVLLAASDGIYALEIPSDPSSYPWQKTHIIVTNSDEGFHYADLDGDGDLDIAAGSSDGDAEHYTTLSWYENPDTKQENWNRHFVGNTVHAIDRVKIADLNGDKLPDIAVAEEQYPPQGPTAFLFWFENRKNGEWKRHTVVQQYSLHNLDISDMDRDGDMDLITAEHKGEKLKLQIWENDGMGNFKENLIDTGKESHLGTLTCDLDNDGDLDIISNTWDFYKYLHLWRNDAIDGKKTQRVHEYPERGNIKISEVFYKGSPHYKINTHHATWYLEKRSGGISSLIDREGNDWINWSDSGKDTYPASAAADYRGFPNMIHASRVDNGAGHPGFDVVKKVELLQGNTIRFSSTSGELVWSYTFFDEYLRLDIDKISRGQLYWILYEGPVGGKFSPSSAYWGTDEAMRSVIPDYIKGETLEENWQWVYFGDRQLPRVLFAAQHSPDHLPDIMGFMGATREGLKSEKGMVVFGFGRSKETQALMNDLNSFYFGFFEESVQTEGNYNKLKEYMKVLVQ